MRREDGSERDMKTKSERERDDNRKNDKTWEEKMEGNRDDNKERYRKQKEW